MKAMITVGLGFGDEGKGATIDYLASELVRKAVAAGRPHGGLVVRYSGGAQAGHNVELADGRRHTFSQFGAGTLQGVPAWLGPRMIVAPATLPPEADHLQSLGVVDPWALLSVHPDALISTGYHVAMNRLREIARGEGRHGSCGLGIGESRSYWLKHGPDAITAGDLADRRGLVRKLTLLRERLLIEMQELPKLDREWADLLHGLRPSQEADLLQQDSQRLTVRELPPPFETALFEGAQGVLLDEWHGLHPYTTWSTVTPLHARELCEEWGIDDVTTLGITRAYSTRHGAGPFPTYSPAMTAALPDRGNPANAWQGSLRAGPLDLVLLDYAARICEIDELAVTCLDQLPAQPSVVRHYAESSRLALPRGLKEQEQLTRFLSGVTPLVERTSELDLLASLEAIAPVSLLARGPKLTDRTLRSLPLDHESIMEAAQTSKVTISTPPQSTTPDQNSLSIQEAKVRGTAAAQPNKNAQAKPTAIGTPLSTCKR